MRPGGQGRKPGPGVANRNVARRFPEDRPLMLVAELDGQIIGAGFAFRRCSQPGGAVTLRNVVRWRCASSGNETGMTGRLATPRASGLPFTRAGAYDLDIDTGAVDPWRAAALVLAALADGKARTQ